MKLLEKMREESLRPTPMIAKTIRYDEDLDKEMVAFAKAHKLKLSIVQRKAMELGWEAIKRESL